MMAKLFYVKAILHCMHVVGINGTSYVNISWQDNRQSTNYRLTVFEFLLIPVKNSNGLELPCNAYNARAKIQFHDFLFLDLYFLLYVLKDFSNLTKEFYK